MYDKTFLKQQSAHNSIFYNQFGLKKIATCVNTLTSRFSPPQNNAECPPLVFESANSLYSTQFEYGSDAFQRIIFGFYQNLTGKKLLGLMDHEVEVVGIILSRI